MPGEFTAARSDVKKTWSLANKLRVVPKRGGHRLSLISHISADGATVSNEFITIFLRVLSTANPHIDLCTLSDCL